MVGALLLECLLSEDVSSAKKNKGGRALSDHWPPDESRTEQKIRRQTRMSTIDAGNRAISSTHLNAFKKRDMTESNKFLGVD